MRDSLRCLVAGESATLLQLLLRLVEICGRAVRERHVASANSRIDAALADLRFCSSIIKSSLIQSRCSETYK